MRLSIHRIYERDIPDGRRILVDRLWPRGIKKSPARWDDWLRDVAPSTDLRRWYGHQVDRFEEFVSRYEAELNQEPAAEAVRHLIDLSNRSPVILLTATKDIDHSGAKVLLDHVLSRAGGESADS